MFPMRFFFQDDAVLSLETLGSTRVIWMLEVCRVCMVCRVLGRVYITLEEDADSLAVLQICQELISA